MAGWILLRRMGSKLYARTPSLEHQSPKSTQITISNEKQESCSLPETDSRRGKSRLRGQHTNFHLQPLTLDAGKRGVHCGLEMPEERLGMEALGRELRE